MLSSWMSGRVPNPPDQLLLDLRHVEPPICCKCRMSRSSIDAAIAVGDFPKPVRVGLRGIRWFAEEIYRWEGRPRGGGAG